jgi:quercetin dioxygenase-like cupin family protein
MKLVHFTEVPLIEVNVEGAEKASIRKVLTTGDGAPNFTMRIFELAEGGCTPYHAHEWEHEIFIVEGKGVLVDENGNELELIPGKAALVLPMEKHQFKNISKETFKFMCLVPNAYA